jgi:hypothetical protein
MAEQHAYTTADPETVTAYTHACQVHRTAALRAVAAARQLGHNTGPAVRSVAS